MKFNIFKHKPLYTVQDVHTYIDDIATIEAQKNDNMSQGDTDSAGEYIRLLEVMREVLLVMVDHLVPYDRKKLEDKINVTTSDR